MPWWSLSSFVLRIPLERIRELKIEGICKFYMINEKRERGGRILEWAKGEKWDQTTSLTRLATWGVGDEWFPEGGEWQQKSEITALMSYRNDIKRKLSRLHWGKKRNLKQGYAQNIIAMARHWVFKSKNDLYMIFNWSLNERLVFECRRRILIKFSPEKSPLGERSRGWRGEKSRSREKRRMMRKRSLWSDTRNNEFCEISCRWTRG